MKWVKIAILVVTAILACLKVIDAAAADLAPVSACPTWSSTQMRCLHNWTRAEHGLTPLQPSPTLFVAAGRKADDNETSGLFSHDPYGYGWDSYLTGNGWQTWGENILYGYPTIRTAYQGWLASPGHYANIVNPAYKWYGSGYRAYGPLPRFWAVDLAG